MAHSSRAAATSVERPTYDTASKPPPILSAYFAGGFLGGGNEHGAAIDIGVRVRPSFTTHWALDASAGYGVIASGSALQDRWWLMPEVVYMAMLSTTSVEVGAGLGLGASSGYASASSYAAAPFTPTWAYQLVPTVRAHLGVSREISPAWTLFARVEAGALVLEGSELGSRVGPAQPGFGDRSWYGFSIGGRVGLL